MEKVKSGGKKHETTENNLASRRSLLFNLDQYVYTLEYVYHF